jgi:glycosyltransferase involved in cell wall biosynthesis
VSNADYILVLPSWYPNKTSPYNGDFIKRHIVATNPFIQQKVIVVVKDTENKITSNYHKEVVTENAVAETIVYYKSVKTGIAVLDRFLSHAKYMKLYKRAIQECIAENGLPKLTHVHIAYKAGLPACWVKNRFNIPFVLSEQSVVYLPEADYNLKTAGKGFRRITKKVIRQADFVTGVSNYLLKHINAFVKKEKQQVIFNVVDKNIFYPNPTTEKTVTSFVHVSNFTEQKNFEAILHAVVLLKEKTSNFVVDCYGSVTPAYQKLVADLHLTDFVIFKGEHPQELIASALQHADALVLFSAYETFGCVLIEAIACGIPAIVSDLPVFREFLTEHINVFFVEKNNESALAIQLLFFCENKFVVSAEKIAKTSTPFSYDNIGKQFYDVYQQVLKEKQ